TARLKRKVAMNVFAPLMSDLAEIRAVRRFGRIGATRGPILTVTGLGARARLGDRVLIEASDGREIGGEVLALAAGAAEILPEGAGEGVGVGDRVEHLGRNTIAPDDSWIGR